MEARKRAEAQDDANRRFDEELAELRVVGENDTGTVKVEVDVNGALRRMFIHDRAMKQSGDKLRDEIMRGVVAAQQHIAVKVEEITVREFGAGSATAQHFTAFYADRFGKAKR